MDDFDAPTCPICWVVLRDEGGALVCPEHGVIIEAPAVEMPLEFEGPDFHQR